MDAIGGVEFWHLHSTALYVDTYGRAKSLLPTPTTSPSSPLGLYAGLGTWPVTADLNIIIVILKRSVHRVPSGASRQKASHNEIRLGPISRVTHKETFAATG